MFADNNTVTTMMSMNNILCSSQTSPHGPTPQQHLPVKPTLFQRIFFKQQCPITNIREKQSQPQFTQQRRFAKQQPFAPQQKQSSCHQQLPVPRQSHTFIITAKSDTTLPLDKLPGIGEFLIRNQTGYKLASSPTSCDSQQKQSSCLQQLPVPRQSQTTIITAKSDTTLPLDKLPGIGDFLIRNKTGYKLASSPTACDFSGSEVYTSQASRNGRYGSICPVTKEVTNVPALQVHSRTSFKRKVSAITEELTEEPRAVKQKRERN